MISVKTLSIFILFQAACAIASSLPPSKFADLLRRQSTNPLPPIDQIPQQCQTTCAGPVTTVQTCGTTPKPSCICLTSFQSALFACYSCLGQAVGSSNFAVPQQNIDQLTEACDQAGLPLPVLTFPGQSSSRSLSTVGPTGAKSTASTNNATSSTALFTSISNATSTALSQTSSTTSLVTQTLPSALPTSSSPVVTQPASTTTNPITSGNSARKHAVHAVLYVGAGVVAIFML